MNKLFWSRLRGATLAFALVVTTGGCDVLLGLDRFERAEKDDESAGRGGEPSALRQDIAHVDEPLPPLPYPGGSSHVLAIGSSDATLARTLDTSELDASTEHASADSGSDAGRPDGASEVPAEQ